MALPIMLATHQPLDLVIIMLGTNDLKWAARSRAFDAALGMGRLIEIVQHYAYNAKLRAARIARSCRRRICARPRMSTLRSM